MSKEKLSFIKKQISDFKSKKATIDNIFLTVENDNDLKSKIEEIAGKDEGKNPFIVEYTHIAKLKRKIDKLQKDNANNKIKKDDFSEELKLARDDISKENITSKINDITNRISTNYSTISSLNKEIEEYQSKLNKKMSDIEKDLLDNIKKISTQSEK
jgi:hypothetical protein